MGLRELKARLNNLDKSEIIKLVSEMYKKIPSAKDYLDIYASGDIKDLTEKHKKEIEKYIYPSGKNMVLREAEARKLIREVRKLKVMEMNIELELHYVDCCLEVISDFGYCDENYYISIEKMFESATAGICELGLEEKFKKRIEKLSTRANEFGIELYY